MRKPCQCSAYLFSIRGFPDIMLTENWNEFGNTVPSRGEEHKHDARGG